MFSCNRKLGSPTFSSSCNIDVLFVNMCASVYIHIRVGFLFESIFLKHIHKAGHVIHAGLLHIHIDMSLLPPSKIGSREICQELWTGMVIAISNLRWERPSSPRQLEASVEELDVFLNQISFAF